MLTLWFHLILYRFSRSREADKGKNKGKKTGQNEITPGGGMAAVANAVAPIVLICILL